MLKYVANKLVCNCAFSMGFIYTGETYQSSAVNSVLPPDAFGRRDSCRAWHGATAHEFENRPEFRRRSAPARCTFTSEPNEKYSPLLGFMMVHNSGAMVRGPALR